MQSFISRSAKVFLALFMLSMGAVRAAWGQSLNWEGQEGVFITPLAYTVQSNDKNFGRPVVAATGSGPYVATPQRWGDYSWAVLDPNGTSVWMATEYMPPKSSQTTNGRRPWGTRVLQVVLQ